MELGVAKVNLNEIPSKQIFDWRPKLVRAFSPLLWFFLFFFFFFFLVTFS